MNPADDFTVPLVKTTEVSDLSKLLINTPPIRNGSNLVGTQPPLPPNHPRVADAVNELSALFPVSDSERAFHEEQIKERIRAIDRARSRKPNADRTYLQAHEVVIDQLLMDPGITTTALSAATGYSRQWLHKIMSADAFQAKLASRQAALCDPIILSAIKDRLNGVVSRSLEILEERLDNDKISLDAALSVFAAGSKALGLGIAKAPPPTTHQFVVHMPAVGMDAAAWMGAHGGTALGATDSTQTTHETTTIEAASSAEAGTSVCLGAIITEVLGEIHGN